MRNRSEASAARAEGAGRARGGFMESGYEISYLEASEWRICWNSPILSQQQEIRFPDYVCSFVRDL
jgi:hypothetical protein